MTSKLKAFGVALMAAFAIGAVAASASQAAATFHSELENTTFTVPSNTTAIFNYEKTFQVECKKVTITNELNLKGTTTTTALTLKPTYDECTDEGGLPTHVSMNGCDFLYTLTGNDDTDGPVHLQCPAGQSITMKITSPPGVTYCTYHVGPQTPKGVATYENKGMETTREITVKNALTGITATRTGNALCGAATSNVASFSGDFTLLGEKSGGTERVGIWVT